jgi:hypothetical protein
LEKFILGLNHFLGDTFAKRQNMYTKIPHEEFEIRLYDPQWRTIYCYAQPYFILFPNLIFIKSDINEKILPKALQRRMVEYDKHKIIKGTHYWDLYKQKLKDSLPGPPYSMLSMYSCNETLDCFIELPLSRTDSIVCFGGSPHWGRRTNDISKLIEEFWNTSFGSKPSNEWKKEVDYKKVFHYFKCADVISYESIESIIDNTKYYSYNPGYWI